MSARRLVARGVRGGVLLTLVLAVVVIPVVGTLPGTPAALAQECPATPGDAFAFLPVSPTTARCPPSPVVRWTTPRVVVECGFFATPAHGVPCGLEPPAACAEACRAAATVWNDELAGRFRFVAADATTPVGFCDLSDGRTSVGASDVICDGSRIPNNVLAVTFRVSLASGPQAGRLLDADITVNQRFAFSPALFRATLGHEFGHVLGLDHPDQCGRDANVLMRSAFRFGDASPCFLTVPAVDDVNGARLIYPVVEPVPQPTAVCGDADGNGRLTVTDGVQILRAAAELSSRCTPAACDVDGDGRITVGDAVAVLRGAAGLAFAAGCGR